MLVGLERGSVGQLVNRGLNMGQQGPGSGSDKVGQQGSAGLSRVNEARKWVSGGQGGQKVGQQGRKVGQWGSAGLSRVSGVSGPRKWVSGGQWGQ